MDGTWGLLGPEFLSNARRTRTLGLGASVRAFNDLAVPGLGGVWFGKQLLLATLGVAVAEEARSRGAKVPNIEMANSIEALACCLAFKANGWNSDPRLRGSTKLQGKDDFSFRVVRQRNFYVSQPMRMATVQALPALGFVESESERFNAFRCTEEGRQFIEEATNGFRPYNRTVFDHLTSWAQSKDDLSDTPALRLVLSPVEPLTKETAFLLRENLIRGGNEHDQRRRNALAWVETLRKEQADTTTWADRPKEILNDDHWRDLQAGALFFKARDAAIAALDEVEIFIGNQSTNQSLSFSRTPDSLTSLLSRLKSAADEYLNFGHEDQDAKSFCRECANDDPARVIRALVSRDGRVLRLVGNEIKPGPAFRGSKDPIEDDEDQVMQLNQNVPLPEGISRRMKNLYRLNLDMHGELDEWLKPAANRGEA